MDNERKFYRCSVCGNMAGLLENVGVPVVCCGKEMEELVPNTSDGAKEKHVPVIKREGKMITVEVGSVPHPMIESHYIQWIALAADAFTVRKKLQPGEEAKLEVTLDYDGPLAAYEYCNLHGLWKGETE